MSPKSYGIYEARFPSPGPSNSSIYRDSLMMNLDSEPVQMNLSVIVGTLRDWLYHLRNEQAEAYVFDKCSSIAWTQP